MLKQWRTWEGCWGDDISGVSDGMLNRVTGGAHMTRGHFNEDGKKGMWGSVAGI